MTTEPQYLSDRALTARLEVSRATIWRWARNKQFPQPIKFHGLTRWRLADVEAWEQEQEGKAA